jgi:hypothetical protein
MKFILLLLLILLLILLCPLTVRVIIEKLRQRWGRRQR